MSDSNHTADLAKARPKDTHENDDAENAGLRREPGLEAHKEIAPEPVTGSVNEFDMDADEPECEAIATRTLARSMRQVARQISVDPRDAMDL
ncbi:hypothetical protein [Phyllobacterium endophyticum]|uniref:hypothetical protein n=1 Tax=Phyllobacterium endophyticum TaxID=1149773 RepID=UPI0011CB84AC|nr:hypothetical protein [Phyllobacterium endophyticum]TXR50387.1 hypothetical protein FVA77_03505 [Phyllobacterium endophyticum]